MRLFGFGFLVIAVTAVSACNSSPATNSSAAAHGGSGRYLGIGVYPASDLWQHLAATDRPRDAAAATLADDTELIVVVDSNSGEIRQCGNLSGHCIGMNPWAAPLGQGRAAPVALDQHMADLLREQDENNTTATAGPARPSHRR
jgi:hypothetical protein